MTVIFLTEVVANCISVKMSQPRFQIFLNFLKLLTGSKFMRSFYQNNLKFMEDPESFKNLIIQSFINGVVDYELHWPQD